MRASLAALALVSFTAVLSAQPRTDLHGDPLPHGALARLGSIRLRPGATVKFLAFAPDGKQVACWAEHDVATGLLFYDVATGRELRKLATPSCRAGAFTWLADGRGLAVVFVLNKSGPFLWEFTDPNSSLPPASEDGKYGSLATRCVISADGRWVARATRDPDDDKNTTVEVWPWISGRMLADLKATWRWELAEEKCSKLLFSQDGRELLAFCTVDKRQELVRFDLANGTMRPRLTIPHLGQDDYWPNNNVALSRRLLALAPTQGPCLLLDLDADQAPKPLPFSGLQYLYNQRRIHPVLFARDGRDLVAFDSHGYLRCWDLAQERLRWKCEQVNRPASMVMAISPDGRCIAGGDSDGVIRLWDAATGADGPSFQGLQRDYRADVAVSPDGRSAVVTADSFEGLQQWDLSTGRMLRENAKPHCIWLGFAPGKDGLLVAEYQQRLYRWETSANELQPVELEKFADLSVNSRFQFSSDGKVLVGNDSDKVSFWNWPQKTLLRRWSLSEPVKGRQRVGSWTVAVNEDGSQLAALVGRGRDDGIVDERAIELWDAAQGKRIRSLSDADLPFGSMFNPYCLLAFSPDQRGIIANFYTFRPSAGAETIRCFDVAAGQALRKYIAPTNPRNRSWRSTDHFAFSPDGRTLASADHDHAVVLYELATGLPRRVLDGHRNGVNKVAFTPDGRRLVSFSHDLTGLVWDISLGAAAKVPASDDELKAAWDELTNTKDGAKVQQALAALAGSPKGSASLIGERLPPAVAPEAKHIARLIVELDNADFAVRNKAFAELDRLGELVLSHLRAHLKQPLSLEVARRLQRLIETHDPANPNTQRLREMRAIEVLEQLDTPAARAVLQGLAMGASSARRTQDAAAAVQRLHYGI